MNQPAPQPVLLSDYRPPAFLIDHTRLHFELDPAATEVTAELTMRRNPAAQATDRLRLDGVELELCSVTLEGQPLSPQQYRQDAESLTISGVPEAFTLRLVTRIHPADNSALEGLYLSQGRLCTQCEAEGFRKITYYLDRPDVMSRFSTTLVGDAERFPVLLSNGNPVAHGSLADGRHWVTWDDPFRKPCYLFALVAGRLDHHASQFHTRSGRTVQLRIHVEPKDLDKCAHAMASLQQAMAWDEQHYGCEYDLDQYNIVAIDDFNMGAMENKGLNIFNTSCVLAHPQTTTDAAFARVAAVVAHEYFHNWSGNRVTCRDWFQLSLKEGFTVFRDQQFSADLGSATVKRIEDVNLLRTVQFAEDSGPMAHPIRPDSYLEISNFYTPTVYEKGAEVVRMLHQLLGAQPFRRGCDHYFSQHDGEAVTTDHFVSAMEAANDVDLSQFRRWYSQAGTPIVRVEDAYDAESRRYTLTISQSTPSTPGQPGEAKQPLVIPLSLALYDGQGREMPLQCDDEADAATTQRVFAITESRQQLRFRNVAERPTPSLLRGFSAPVRLEYDYSRDALRFLARHDSDGFNRWEAMQRLMVLCIQEQIASHLRTETTPFTADLIETVQALLDDQQLTPAELARMVQLPSEAYLSGLAEPIEVEAIHAARRGWQRELGQQLIGRWQQLFEANRPAPPYRADAEQSGRRALRAVALEYLAAADVSGAEEASRLYFAADNMTEALSGLRTLLHSPYPELEALREQALSHFYQRWQHEPLVVDQWLALQATAPRPETLQRVETLLMHPAFDLRNPNKSRALIGSFAGQNPIQFHRTDGRGYRFLVDQVLRIDPLNPQIAARLVLPLTRWKKYGTTRQTTMRAELARIAEGTTLSRDLLEVVSKSLASEAV